MTGFRQMQNLHAYSGGTVRDSHPVSYSLAVLLPHPQALKRNIYFMKSIYHKNAFVNYKTKELHGCGPQKEYVPMFSVSFVLQFLRSGSIIQKNAWIFATDRAEKGEGVMTVFDHNPYQAEAKAKWGQTEAYRQHAEKTKDYSRQKWNALSEEMDRIMADFALCMQKGETPDSPAAQELVKRLQAHITAHYYPCTDEILAGLGQMYVADERFQSNIDRHAEGTAAFICEAIAARLQ